MEHNSLKRIDEIVKSLEPELKELALKIHANPELGNQEFKACRRQRSFCLSLSIWKR